MTEKDVFRLFARPSTLRSFIQEYSVKPEERWQRTEGRRILDARHEREKKKCGKKQLRKRRGAARTNRVHLSVAPRRLSLFEPTKLKGICVGFA